MFHQDFYVDNHWQKLPPAWRSHFNELPPEQMCFLLNIEQKTPSRVECVWPLSLLALKQAFQQLCIARCPSPTVSLSYLVYSSHSTIWETSSRVPILIHICIIHSIIEYRIYVSSRKVHNASVNY